MEEEAKRAGSWVCSPWKQARRTGTHHLPQLLVGNDDDIRRVPDGGGGSSNVREDHLCNQDLSGVKVERLT